VKEHLESSPEKRTGKRPPKIGKVSILDVPEALDKRSCLERDGKAKDHQSCRQEEATPTS
jgi:hypothetical protein